MRRRRSTGCRILDRPCTPKCWCWRYCSPANPRFAFESACRLRPWQRVDPLLFSVTVGARDCPKRSNRSHAPKPVTSVVVGRVTRDNSLAIAKNPSEAEEAIYARAVVDRTTCRLAGNLQAGQRGEPANLRWTRTGRVAGNSIDSLDAVSRFLRAGRFKWKCDGPERNELVLNRERAFMGFTAANAR